jgi:IclR family KDG regulon transcriptional repressor
MKSASSTGEIYRVQVLDRAFDVLDTLATSGDELGAAEIGVRLALNKSTAHRLLMILQQRRFVERNAETGKYRLGWRLFELGSLAASRLDLYAVARPYIAELVEATGETAHLGILRGGEIISIVNVESNRSVRTPSTVGRRSPTYCTSLGKAILANLPDDAARKLIDQIEFRSFTPHTCTDASCLRNELAKVRRQGYSLDDEEIEEGLRCIGAPIWNHDSRVMGAVSIAGPSYRVGGDHLAQLVESVVAIAGRLSAALGFRKLS